jgi:4-amino-4-deoxy-L-arabinose transferase-like glycosyltransferase
MKKDFLKKPTTIILIALILSGFALRIYNITEPSYWIDEAYSINASEIIKDKGLPILATGEIYKNGLLNSYLITLSSLLLGNNELGYRIISVLFGVLLIPLIFFVGRKILKSEHRGFSC